MKLFKKIATLCLAMLACVSFGVAAACDDDVPDSSSSSSDAESSMPDSSSPEDSSAGESEAAFVYRVKVQNATGYGLKGVHVALYDGETEIAAKTTSGSGYATFGRSDIIALGEYTVQVSDLPRGYEMAEPDRVYQTLAVEGFETFVQLDPTGVIRETAPIGTGYALGEVMYDFSVKTSDGGTFTLSEVLEEKDMVLINFWATWCGPCKSEFPAMNNAYIEYEDKVGIIAISTTDGMQAVKEFKASNGLTFDMTSNSEAGISLKDMFNTTYIPLTVMVDRYGVITFYDSGSMTMKTQFTSQFEKFVGDDYVPTIVSGKEETPDNGNDESDLVKPNVEAPDIGEVTAVMGNGFEYGWDKEDEYSWPWLISEDQNYLYSPVTNVHGGYSTLYASFEAGPGDAVYFDYVVNSEEAADILYVLVDGVPVHRISGANAAKEWKTCTAYVFKDYEEQGTHEITFLYLKDSATSIEEEAVWIKNLRLEDNADKANGLIFRHAANVLNTDENATTQYKHYAKVVYNEEDGYYHVDEKDGPLLFANLMLSSRWSETSVWLLAYSDYIVSEGYNFHYDIEDIAWGANQPVPGKSLTYGYTPVTKEVKELLQYTAASEAVREYGYKYWDGETHENEWLEMCVYYEAYGNTPQMEDPMKTITFHAAVEVYEDVKNTAEVLFSMTPRGFKYKFIPEKDGVYNIYSVGSNNTVCFFFQDDQTTFRTYDNVLGATRIDENGKEVVDDNFDFHVYLEAGKTYYLALTTYLDVVCKYDFYIEYVGATYSYMEHCATDLYSYNEVSGELFLPDAIEYVYDEEQDAYFTASGDRIYVDMTHPTMFFLNDSLYDIAKNALNYEVEKRAFYINGVDYTNTVRRYCAMADLNEGNMRGYMPLNRELFDILVAITTSSKYEGISDSWQMLCYYYTTLGA